jgi:mRNA-degrading endonuclease toxin of MazEF toxin-antitoxin module
VHLFVADVLWVAMVRPYVPDAGDIVWISFSPQAGHEQAGHRPAVVLSPAVYNASGEASTQVTGKPTGS